MWTTKRINQCFDAIVQVASANNASWIVTTKKKNIQSAEQRPFPSYQRHKPISELSMTSCYCFSHRDPLISPASPSACLLSLLRRTEVYRFWMDSMFS